MRHHLKNRRIWLIAGSVAGVILITLAVAWFFMIRGDGKTPASTQKQTNQNQPTQQPTSQQPADPTPISFRSAKLNIEITHRKDWTLKEAADGAITLTSPNVGYSKADDSSTTGPFTLKIRKGVNEGMKATIDKAIAARDSEVIAYKEPTDQQRFYTNVSYAGKDETSFNFFIVTGNTELKTGNAFAYTLPLDESFYLVVGGFGTDKTNSLGFDSAAKSATDSEAVREAIKVVESLKIY